MALPRADREVLRVQATAGRKGVEAYTASQGVLKDQRNATVRRAMQDAALRGSPAAAVRQLGLRVSAPYNKAIGRLAAERGMFRSDMLAANQRWSDYNDAVIAAQKLIPGQVAEAVAPIRAQGRFDLAQMRTEADARLNEIEAQTRLTEAQMKAAAEAYLRQKAEEEARARAAAARSGGNENWEEDELGAFLAQGAEDILGKAINRISGTVRRNRRAARAEYQEANPMGNAALADAQARLNALLNAPPAVTADEQASRDARITELRNLIEGFNTTGGTDFQNRMRQNFLTALFLNDQRAQNVTAPPDISNLPVDVGANLSPEPVAGSAPTQSISASMGYGMGEQAMADLARQYSGSTAATQAVPQMLPPEIPGNYIQAGEAPEITWNEPAPTDSQRQAAQLAATVMNAAIANQQKISEAAEGRADWRDWMREQYPQGFATGPRLENQLTRIGGPQGTNLLGILPPIYTAEGVERRLGGQLMPNGQVAPTAPQALDLAVNLAAQRLRQQAPGRFTVPEFMAASRDVYDPGATLADIQAEQMAVPTPREAWDAAAAARRRADEEAAAATEEWREGRPGRIAARQDRQTEVLRNDFFEEFGVPFPDDVGTPQQVEAAIRAAPEQFNEWYESVREQLVSGQVPDIETAFAVAGVTDPFFRDIIRGMLRGV